MNRTETPALSCGLRPDTERRQLAAVVLAGFCAFLFLYAPQPLLPMLALQFHLSASAISLVITASTAGVALAAPFVGILADRIGPGRIIVPATLLSALPGAMAALPGSFGHLLFWRFVQGIITPGIFGATLAYTSEKWEGRSGGPISAYVAGTVLGGFAGRMLAALIGDRFSWEAAFMVLSVLIAVCAFVIWLWLPAELPHHVQRRKSQDPRVILDHLRNPQLLATYAAGFCVLFTLVATFTYINFYLAAPPFNLGTVALGLMFVAYPISAAATAILGRYIDRFGHRAAMIAAFTVGIAGVLMTLNHRIWLIVLGLSICCTGIFLAQSAAQSYVGIIATNGRAAAVGLYASAYYLGGTLGGAIPGGLWKRGGWPACVVLIVFVQLLMIGVATLFWQRRKQLTRVYAIPAES